MIKQQKKITFSEDSHTMIDAAVVDRVIISCVVFTSFLLLVLLIVYCYVWYRRNENFISEMFDEQIYSESDEIKKVGDQDVKS